MCQEGPGLARAMFFLQAGEPCVCGGILPQEEHGGFGKGPRELGLAACAAGGARAGASSCSGTLDETTGGGPILHTRASLARMTLGEPPEAEELADPGTVCRSYRVWASGCWAVLTMVRARSRRHASSEVSRARATARLLCTAGSAQRSATPSRLACSAIVVPMAGRWYGLGGLGPWARSAPRVRARGRRRRSQARGARLAAGET